MLHSFVHSFIHSYPILLSADFGELDRTLTFKTVGRQNIGNIAKCSARSEGSLVQSSHMVAQGRSVWRQASLAGYFLFFTFTGTPFPVFAPSLTSLS